MQQTGLATAELNVYGLYAYDTVWTVAYCIDRFINEYGNISFSFNDKLLGIKTTEIQLNKLRVFDGGPILRRKLLETNFTGLSGQIRFNSDRNLISSGYDIINIDKMEIHRIGFWSNVTGFSVSPPETLKVEKNSYSQPDQKLNNATWPGGETETPRGWVIAVNEKPLRIVVPNRTSFVEFVTEYNDHDVRGYCIDIFNEATKLIPYDVPHRFEPFGDGHANPKYDELVRMVAKNVSKTCS